MSAAEIARGLGLSRTRRGCIGRCPACGCEDAFTVEDRGVTLVRCHIGCDQRDGLDALRRRGLWRGRDGGDRGYAPAEAAKGDDALAAEWARALWGRATLAGLVGRRAETETAPPPRGAVPKSVLLKHGVPPVRVHADRTRGKPPALYPYQRAGAAFLAERRIGFLWDDPGLGKTVQTIRAADDAGRRRLLIVCPAIARTNWAREVERWGRRPRAVQVIAGGADRLDPAADAVILSYDGAQRPEIYRQFNGLRFDACVLDEADALTNPESRRTRAVLGERCAGGGLASQAGTVWALTGTPVRNGPHELWPALRSLAPDAIAGSSYEAFLQRYCNHTKNQWGGIVVRSGRNMAELRDRLRPLALRRRIEQVLPELPALRWATHEVAVAEAAALLPPDDPELAEALITGAAGRTESIARAVHDAGRLKVAPTVDLAAEVLKDPERKLVIFARHLDVIAAVAEALGRRVNPLNVAVITGSSSPRTRQTIIDDFQSAVSPRALVCQILAAGTAITLTRAHDVIFAETTWVPRDLAQAAGRCLRIGQPSSVLCRVVSLAGTLDSSIAAVLARKTKITAAVTEGQL